jgi:NTP pyrophosphatase (non-canonical NTP hydrolase)
MDIHQLTIVLRAFAAERDWDQFHSPKNLAMALSVETAELLEHFQWLSEPQSHSLPAEVSQQVAEEIADVQIYLVRLADKLGVDIDAAVSAKLELNRLKYPADKVRGKAAKYTEYEPKT